MGWDLAPRGLLSGACTLLGLQSADTIVVRVSSYYTIEGGVLSHTIHYAALGLYIESIRNSSPFWYTIFPGRDPLSTFPVLGYLMATVIPP